MVKEEDDESENTSSEDLDEEDSSEDTSVQEQADKTDVQSEEEDVQSEEEDVQSEEEEDVQSEEEEDVQSEEEDVQSEEEDEAKKTPSKQEATNHDTSSYQISHRSIIGIGIAVVAIVIIAALLAAQPLANTETDRLATVNGEAITEDDLSATQGMDQSQALRQAIITTVLRQRAEAENVTVSESEAESQLQQRLEARNRTLTGLKETLQQRGVSYEERLSSYRSQLATQRYLDSQIDQESIQPTEEELRQLYNQSLQQFPDGQAPDYEQVQPQLVQRVEQQKRQRASAQVIRGLVQNANVTTADGVNFTLPKPQ
jgi:hypothetical protein